ncbi:hypothetical protein [Carnobacterium funditum]|uniref:hypothetical protein n=1 Tax=Carnobacterium funditum TaxID=2752 RepID=UPI0005559981|nr:hypothetical protein [Carnobacterium funditum]
MKDYLIELPNETGLTIDVTDSALYNYDFNSYSLQSLQEYASLSVVEKMKKSIYSNISKVTLIDKLAHQGETKYVANISDYAKEKLDSGEWVLGIRKKTGETYAVIRDSVTGKNKSFLTLDKEIAKGLGTLPELSAIQGQLASISEQIEKLNHLVQRVEQGQYNDRYAGFFSARQLVIEALSSNDEEIKKELLISAVKVNNDTIGKLMLSLHQDALEFIDIKTKRKDAKRIENILQNSMGYLNSTVQLNLVAYTALGEEQSLMATLGNYNSFIEQVLLQSTNDERSVAWLIDNAYEGNNGRFVELTKNITSKIYNLMEESKTKRIVGESRERIENKEM